MSCDSFFERVAGLHDGTRAGSDREETFAHLETCAECRGLHAALAASDRAPEDPRLTEAILAVTSGAACDSARLRLPARLDGELDDFEAGLVDAHLCRCRNCAGLARTLEQVQEGLPLLATADPDPSFVEQVLARTSRHPRREPLDVRFAAAVSRWLARPRAAWEGAFVATVVLAIPFLVPGSPLADLPGRALERVRESSAAHGGALERVRGTMDGIGLTFVAGASTGWEGIRRSLGTFPEAAASRKANGAAGGDQRTPDANQETKR